MGAGNSGLYNNTNRALKPEHLIDELRESGVKFNEENLVMITKTKKNELVWLEKGNEISGLKHIIYNHGKQFNSKGINDENISNVLKLAIESGKIVGKQGKMHKKPRIIYEVNYNGKNIKVAISISDNGYIVGANIR